MGIWSLATQQQDDGAIDVSLYPTEYEAYEALTDIIFGEDPDDVEKKEALRSRIRRLRNAADRMQVIDDVLRVIGLNVTVTRHESPASRPFLLRARLVRTDQPDGL